ncbi:ParB N-terminal domain-containing protein, partial [Cupriavidus necator]|uniref:ParB N-terminal domain-containing protein n=1 Tax=Cupriavidus necator TaxID=106590 RepID=UPI0030F474C6
MSNPQDLVTIRVRDLVISPRNVRKTPSSTIRELAASIKHHGLLQALTVIDVPAKGKKPGRTEVIAGGRRLRALQMLIDTGDLDTEHRVLCAVRTGDAAEEISVAENMHEAMHPADEFQAFKDLIDAGSTAEEVAARFGVTPLTVQRRLKLANVSPRLVQGYRDGELNLDQLMAFAITDEHKTQEKLWNQVKDRGNWEKTPEALRRALVKSGSINAAHDKRARFVGLDAYEAAGGPVVRDLFSNGGGFIGDEALLQRLAEEKLEAAAEDVRAEGWAWVKTTDQWTYSDETAYSKSQPKKRALTDEEANLLASLREQAEALNKKIDALDVEDEELDAELASLEAQIEAIESLQQEFTDRQKAKAGAVLTIDHGGQLKVVRGLIKPEDGRKPKKAPADEANGSGAGQDAPPAEDAERPLSERLVTALTAHRTAALQALVAQSPAVALATLLYALVPQIFKALEYRYRYNAVAKVSVTNNRGVGQNAADDLEGSRAWVSLEESIGRWEERIPGEDEDLFAWLQDLSQADQLDLLAVCVAHSINTVEQREDSAGHKHAHQLAAAVDLDMADWWQPTAGSYLASVPKSRRIEAVREAAGEEAANAIAGMKKDAMITAAEQRLEGRRWLPAILRRPGAPATT